MIPFDIHEASQSIIVGAEEHVYYIFLSFHYISFFLRFAYCFDRKSVAYVITLAENKLELKETIPLKAPAGAASFGIHSFISFKKKGNEQN